MVPIDDQSWVGSDVGLSSEERGARVEKRADGCQSFHAHHAPKRCDHAITVTIRARANVDILFCHRRCTA
eukprot:2605595-Pyramimonas_sp.AAC.1